MRVGSNWGVLMLFVRRGLVGLVGLVLTGLVNSACAEGISGTYVGAGSDNVIFVQLVETTGGQLAGRYEQTVLKAEGKFEKMNASVTGSSDGRTVVVTIKPAEFLSGSIIASGTLNGSQLQLSGSGGGRTVNLYLTKSDETDYQKKVALLTMRAIASAADQTKAEQLNHIRSVTKRMATASSATEGQLPKFPPIEKRYRDITEAMRGALTRQSLIVGDGQAAVARGQLFVAINQAGVEAEQLHVSVQAGGRDIKEKLTPLFNDIAVATQHCESASKQNGDHQASCATFSQTEKAFKNSIQTLANAFDRHERVWGTVRREQESIVQEADMAVR